MNVAVRAQHLNLISLCTGGGGLDLGVELAMPGARSVVLVEREAFAVSQLVSAIQQGLLAEAAIWSDVTTFNGRPWRGIVDGVIGGIPCQPHSLAGKRAGSEDGRDLWSDARRIIVQSGAWFVLIENVSGMLSAKPGLDPGALRVRRDLQRLGFDVEGGLFTAAEVGASHERERVFILAVADRQDQRWDVGAATRERHGPQIEARGRRGDVANPGCQRDERRRISRDVPCSPREIESQAHQRQRLRDAACDGSATLVNASRDGRREGWPDQIVRSGRDTVASADDALGYALRAGPYASPHAGIYRSEEGRRPRHEDIAGSSGAMVHAFGGGYHGRPNVAERRSFERTIAEGPGERLGLFPPRPSDLHSWRHTLERAPELEPAFRRVADGLASRLDVARVDRLRLLGNGVVSLEAAYAVRTLATRLAASGSPGAARLVRMMEIAA